MDNINTTTTGEPVTEQAPATSKRTLEDTLRALTAKRQIAVSDLKFRRTMLDCVHHPTPTNDIEALIVEQMKADTAKKLARVEKQIKKIESEYDRMIAAIKEEQQNENE